MFDIIPFVFVIIVMLYFIMVFKRHEEKNNYDERQKLEREKGYAIACKTLLCINTVVILLNAKEITFMPTYILAAVNIYVGIFVFVMYCVIKGAYFGTQYKGFVYPLLCFFASVFTIVCAYPTFSNMPIVKDGMLTSSFLAVMISATFFLMSIVMIVKLVLPEKEDEE